MVIGTEGQELSVPVRICSSKTTMTLCTIEETQLDTLSNENDRARASRSMAQTLCGIGATLALEPFFMGLPWDQISAFVKILAIVGTPACWLSAWWFRNDSKRSLIAADALKKKVKGSSLAADVEVRATITAKDHATNSA
jgi:hypothetical protein